MTVGDGATRATADPALGVVPIDRRRPGPDVVRALALLGVIVMNFHGYLIIRGAQPGDGWAADLFDPWTGPLATRFAATFVLVAGVGVTLLTNSSPGDRARTTEMRMPCSRTSSCRCFDMVSMPPLVAW